MEIPASIFCSFMYSSRSSKLLLAELILIASLCVAGPAKAGLSARQSSQASTMTGSCAGIVFNRLSLQQRVGQLFILGLKNDRLSSAELDAIRSRHIGSVWFTKTTNSGALSVRAVTAAVQSLATETNAGIRFYIGANQEGGKVQSMRGLGFSMIPSALAQGAIEPRILEQRAAEWGQELANAGVNLNFAPVMDVVPFDDRTQNRPIGLLNREYGYDSSTVATHGKAFIRGMSLARIATTAKHFPGMGRVLGNTDETADVVDSATTAGDLATFRSAVEARVPFVMVALATYRQIDPTQLAVFSPIVTRLLRDKLGFQGVILSDDLAATVAVQSTAPAQRAISFIGAGGDMVVSKTVPATLAMVDALVARASSDPIFRARVNDAVRHVLATKDVSGLLPCSRSLPGRFE